MGYHGEVGQSSNLPEEASRSQRAVRTRSLRSGSDEVRAAILHAIEEYWREHGRPPTIREIGSAVGITSSGHVAHHVAMLERQGLLTREPGRSRGLLPTRPVGLRVLGTIAAGEPLEQFDSGEGELLELHELATAMTSVPTGMGSDIFALRVRGTSMIEDGILDGDYVFIAHGSMVTNGTIAVAVQNTGNGGRGAATLKRVFIRPGGVLLKPSNAALAARFVTAVEWDRDWTLQGAVVAVYRRYMPRPTATSR